MSEFDSQTTPSAVPEPTHGGVLYAIYNPARRRSWSRVEFQP